MKLMMFGAKWCQACKDCKAGAMEAAKEMDCEFEYIDSDEDSENVAKYAVKTLPTFIAVNGDAIEHLCDRRDKEEIKDLIRFTR